MSYHNDECEEFDAKVSRDGGAGEDGLASEGIDTYSTEGELTRLRSKLLHNEFR
jgi:hypothetical protein